MIIKEDLKEIIKKINNTFHRPINTAHMEMWNGERTETEIKAFLEKYKNEFKKLYRETSELGVDVLFGVLSTNAATIKANSKFTLQGKITKISYNESHLMQLGTKLKEIALSLRNYKIFL